jgi:hypothetical protein
VDNLSSKVHKEEGVLLRTEDKANEIEHPNNIFKKKISNYE